jgi:hypothetical protein
MMIAEMAAAHSIIAAALASTFGMGGTLRHEGSKGTRRLEEKTPIYCENLLYKLFAMRYISNR